MRAARHEFSTEMFRHEFGAPPQQPVVEAFDLYDEGMMEQSGKIDLCQSSAELWHHLIGSSR